MPFFPYFQTYTPFSEDATGLVRASPQGRKVQRLTAKMKKREMTTNDESTSLAFPKDNFIRQQQQQQQQNRNIPALPL
jgi:hypothetical protein